MLIHGEASPKMVSWLNLGFSRSNADSGCGTVNHKFSGEIVRVRLSTLSSLHMFCGLGEFL